MRAGFWRVNWYWRDVEIYGKVISCQLSAISKKVISCQLSVKKVISDQLSAIS